ncbi:LysR family transcriptional regulator [Serratia quinivorans]|uniref:LysR family transcriptional regulator n=1 Tax=Serratia quinivorans TaxID=137545 RepID=UPI00217A3479|nr:LysR family transcriptional regulator [Serratia quinivorans]CAI0741060.1 D-malate degradation protein R [Serratia quinivorans]CAI0745893.1 D-malate degradation protein R [Serratia quinivorans]CAI0768189.1 D-malate degradation protein R [Serratia quinivorans]CAI1675874.1 D-malate degradation protein R [Serratia quinivorans]CAI2053275.1 D-malate degradation protein R [Serratia quinivorans]
MDKIGRLRVFIQVAEVGSFIRASQILLMPKTTVSAAIQQLEHEMGARLFHRTTRRVQLTSDGELLLEKARSLLFDVQALESLFHRQNGPIGGRLTVDVPSRIARRMIVPALPDFFLQYPEIQLFLSASDRSVDLIQEGIDCVVRVGSLSDSSLVSQPLGRLSMINCASPDYLQRYGIPEQPAQLDEHWVVGYAQPTLAGADSWQWQQDGQLFEKTLPSRVTVNNVENYIGCCLVGLGMMQIPRFDVQHYLDNGSLCEILPQARPPAMSMALLYPHRRQRSARLTAFAEWFSQLIKPFCEI